MPRIELVVSVVAVVLVGLIAAGRVGPATVAQGETPVPEVFQPPEGVTFESLASAPGVNLPPGRADLVVYRLALEPGARLPFDPTNPSTGLVIVESGELTFRVEAAIRVTRTAAPAAAVTNEAVAPAATELPGWAGFTLRPGDSALIPGLVAGEARNAGQVPAVALVSMVTPVAAGTPAAGTPTP